MRVAQTIQTNKPFTTNNVSVLFEIPDGKTVDLLASVRGNEYENLTGTMWGPSLCSIAHVPCGTYFKIIADEDFKINILQ